MDKKKTAAKQAEQAEKSEKTQEKAQDMKGAREARASAQAADAKAQEAMAQDAQGSAREVKGAQGAQGSETKEAAESEALEKALAAVRAEAEDYKRKWYSVSAEYENYRKRTARESAQRYNEGRGDVIVKLFPIADNLDRAYAACKDDATKKGISMVLDAFNKLLAGERIEVIDPVGEAFDAEKHEAIMAVDAADGEESGTVREVYLKGYERDGKVLRFAQVVVTR